VAAAAIEQGNDANGIIWPLAIAPMQIHIIPVNVNDAKSMDVAEEFYAAWEEKGFEVLMDDDRPPRSGSPPPAGGAPLMGMTRGPWRDGPAGLTCIKRQCAARSRIASGRATEARGERNPLKKEKGDE